MRLIQGMAAFLYNCPSDMLIETQLRDNMPSIQPSQFVSLQLQVKEAWDVNNNPDIRRLTPEKIMQSSLALNGTFALFVDSLFMNVTDYAANYRSSGQFSISQKLFDHWKARLSSLRPGDEYDLVDEFADILGMAGWYEWKPDPGSHTIVESGGKEGSTNPDLLKQKHPAAVWFLLDALKRYENLSDERVREISFEIGLLGRKGLDYASADKKYTLKSLPGETFSGLQLMCLMSARCAEAGFGDRSRGAFRPSDDSV
jgi:hypothetical protein